MCFLFYFPEKVGKKNNHFEFLIKKSHGRFYRENRNSTQTNIMSNEDLLAYADRQRNKAKSRKTQTDGESKKARRKHEKEERKRQKRLLKEEGQTPSRQNNSININDVMVSGDTDAFRLALLGESSERPTTTLVQTKPESKKRWKRRRQRLATRESVCRPNTPHVSNRDRDDGFVDDGFDEMEPEDVPVQLRKRTRLRLQTRSTAPKQPPTPPPRIPPTPPPRSPPRSMMSPPSCFENGPDPIDKPCSSDVKLTFIRNNRQVSAEGSDEFLEKNDPKSNLPESNMDDDVPDDRKSEENINTTTKVSSDLNKALSKNDTSIATGEANTTGNLHSTSMKDKLQNLPDNSLVGRVKRFFGNFLNCFRQQTDDQVSEPIPSDMLETQTNIEHVETLVETETELDFSHIHTVQLVASMNEEQVPCQNIKRDTRVLADEVEKLMVEGEDDLAHFDDTLANINSETVRHLDSDYYVSDSEESEVEEMNWLPERENCRNDTDFGLVDSDTTTVPSRILDGSRYVVGQRHSRKHMYEVDSGANMHMKVGSSKGREVAALQEEELLDVSEGYHSKVGVNPFAADPNVETKKVQRPPTPMIDGVKMKREDILMKSREDARPTTADIIKHEECPVLGFSTAFTPPKEDVCHAMRPSTSGKHSRLDDRPVFGRDQGVSECRARIPSSRSVAKPPTLTAISERSPKRSRALPELVVGKRREKKRKSKTTRPLPPVIDRPRQEVTVLTTLKGHDSNEVKSLPAGDEVKLDSASKPSNHLKQNDDLESPTNGTPLSESLPHSIRSKLTSPSRTKNFDQAEAKHLLAAEKRVQILEKKAKTDSVDPNLLKKMEEERRRQLKLQIDNKQAMAACNRQERALIIKAVSQNV